MSDIERMSYNVGNSSKNTPSTSEEVTVRQLAFLKERLVSVLEEIDSISPIQFLDMDGEYIFNFIDLKFSPEEGRVWVRISAEHDNLPSHRESHLKNGRGRPILPVDTDGV